MDRSSRQGFSLIEMLVAATVFSFIAIAVTGIYAEVLTLQRRAQGAARVQENALFVVESLAREIRFGTIQEPAGSDVCSPFLVIDHPVSGMVRYEYDAVDGTVARGPYDEVAGTCDCEEITAPEVTFTAFSFCLSGNVAGDDEQVRVTIPMTIENEAVHPRNRVTVSLQTTVVSRDLTTDLTD